MTPTTLPTNASDQTLLDNHARLELQMKIALQERLILLLNNPNSSINAIMKLMRSLEKLQERPIKQRKAELAANRQLLRERQLTIHENRISLRLRVLDLREAEYQRRVEAAEVRELARQEKAARLAEKKEKHEKGEMAKQAVLPKVSDAYHKAIPVSSKFPETSATSHGPSYSTPATALETFEAAEEEELKQRAA